jgi:hypothetical protein
MKHALENFEGPHGFRDFVFVRAGPDGAYWQRADGMVVRVAAAERERGRIRESEGQDTSSSEWEVALGRSGAT